MLCVVVVVAGVCAQALVTAQWGLFLLVRRARASGFEGGGLAMGGLGGGSVEGRMTGGSTERGLGRKWGSE